jgi:hypothetical protein
MLCLYGIWDGGDRVSLLDLGQAPLLSLGDFRDVIVIIWGILSIVLLATLVLVVVILAFSVKRLISEVRDLLNTGVRPVLSSARETADNVTGTTRFVGDKVVTPIIRVMGVISGVRRGITVFTGLAGRRRHPEDSA